VNPPKTTFNPTLPGVPVNLFRLGKEISRLVPPHSVWRETGNWSECYRALRFREFTYNGGLYDFVYVERAREPEPATPRTLYGAGPATDRNVGWHRQAEGGGAHRGRFLPRPGEIGATQWRRGPTFDVKSLKMYVKTSFFDVEHEVKKDSFFVSAVIDIFLKITYIITFSAIWRQSYRGKYFPRPGKIGLRGKNCTSKR
jgi:hypothetical protein